VKVSMFYIGTSLKTKKKFKNIFHLGLDLALLIKRLLIFMYTSK